MKAIKCLIVFIVLAGAAYAQNAEDKKKIYLATIDEDGIQRIEVLGGGYYYDPDYIIVKKDIPVELIIKKEPGIVPHNIVIRQPEAGMDIRESMSTKQKIIKFTPGKAGKYPFYCDKKLLFFKNHREKGMEGIIEVTE
jgi:plastocyanin domain-containing protein